MPHSSPGDPQWYKDAIIYEVHVRSFHDSNGDGIGDLRGLTQKLDYLQSLGVTAIWLLPFYPSPLKDDGYDISNYCAIHPRYGTLGDFRKFLVEAHNRGMRVITELVLNHTSDQHEWFKRSRKAKPGTPWRDFYVWSDDPLKYPDARIIFTDFEKSNWAYDPIARSYYWHRFYAHQPDLNFDNPAVVKALIGVLDFWFDMGVDGMRLDAVPYLFERDGTNCENLPETYQLLEALRSHVDKKYADRMFLAEANQWPEDAASYFGAGNRAHMAFHFPLMPRLFMGSWMEDRFPIVDIFEQTPAIPSACQWALFLRNHDELTLEMVSDEERDYMYRVYARDPSARINLGIRRRLAPLLGNNRRKIELLNILLFSLPGTPVIYYGDEIGMGDNHFLGDRNGVRTPMQWNGERNAGFSRVNPQQLYLPVIIDPDFHYESVNVENQERNPSSLLWWTRRVIATRKKFKAFGRGSIEFLHPKNPKILAFIREHENERLLVVANLSRFSQAAKLDLSRYAGFVPEEVVSGNKFPRIKNEPYQLTMGFHDYFWLSLRRPAPIALPRTDANLPQLSVTGSWQRVLHGKLLDRMESEVLPSYISGCSWFVAKGRTIQQLKILAALPIGRKARGGVLLLLDVRFSGGGSDQYALPVAYAIGDAAQQIRTIPQAAIAELQTTQAKGILFDAVHSEDYRRELIRVLVHKRTVSAPPAEIVALVNDHVRHKKSRQWTDTPSHVWRADGVNPAFRYGSEFFLKVFRRLDEGVNPELEVSRFLTEHTEFRHTPLFAGALEYRNRGSESVVLAVLQTFVPNQGDAWKAFVTAARDFLDRVLADPERLKKLPDLSRSILSQTPNSLPALVGQLIGGPMLERAALLGKRTAEMHLALASKPDDPAFAPEPFSLHYQRSVYHAMRTSARRSFELLRTGSRDLPVEVRQQAKGIDRKEKELIKRFEELSTRKLSAMKIRIHGDFGLEQVLLSGEDMLILDFEGDPTRSIGERRLKRSPLRDVASMIRSLHYAPYSTLLQRRSLAEREARALMPWADLWHLSVGGTFLHTYLEMTRDASFVPDSSEEIDRMLRAFLLDRCINEIQTELPRRPEWLLVALRGIGLALKR